MSSDIRLAEVGREAPEEVAFGPGTFSRALREPSYALMVAMAIVKGRVFSWWVRIFRPRVVIGRGLRIYGTLCIRGPGTVVLGDDVHIHGTVTPWTNRATARIVVGDRTKLDGTRFSCVQSVEIGADCLIANCRILDTSFHPNRGAMPAYSRPPCPSGTPCGSPPTRGCCRARGSAMARWWPWRPSARASIPPTS